MKPSGCIYALVANRGAMLSLNYHLPVVDLTYNISACILRVLCIFYPVSSAFASHAWKVFSRDFDTLPCQWLGRVYPPNAVQTLPYLQIQEENYVVLWISMCEKMLKWFCMIKRSVFNVSGEVAHGCVLIVQVISLVGYWRSVTNDTLLFTVLI